MECSGIDCASVCVCGCVSICAKDGKHKGNEEQQAKTSEIPDTVCFWILALKVFDYNVFTVSRSAKFSVNV